MKKTELNVEEASTWELVEIIRKQAQSLQKPEEAIWNELIKRFVWIGCPKEDVALIVGLDSILRPLNNGWTMIPPRVRPVHGVGIPPPPPYYRKKVSLSQAVNPPSAQPAQESGSENTELPTGPKIGNAASKKEPQQPEVTLPSNRNSFSLEKLRSELTDSQQKYLDLFWGYYLDCGQWPKTIDFHRDHDREDVRDNLGSRPMNGSIVMEQTGSGDEHYELTLIGILLTKNGEHYEEMRIRLLEFLSKKYYYSKREERKNRYSDEEVADELKLNEEDRKMLGKVGFFDHIYRTFDSSSIGGHWSIEFPRKEIQTIPRNGPFSDYHERIVSQQYFPDWKVFIEDRHAAQSVATFPRGLFSESNDSLDLSKNDDTPPLISVPDLSFVKDEKLQQFATGAAEEAVRCFGATAYSATAVMIVSATEAVLLDLLLQRKGQLSTSKNGPVEKLRLDELIREAAKENLLGSATSSLTQFIREHRNLVHPGKSLREKRILGKGDAHIVWGVFVKICEELS